MKLFNPTPEMIIGKYNGVPYIIDSGHFVNLTSEAGAWIKERWEFLGLVDLSPNGKTSLSGKANAEFQSFIVTKTLEGLDRYITHLQNLLDQYIVRDTEEKTVNMYGTILKHKNVKRIGELLELATRMIKDAEAKYGVSIKKSESDEKTKSLMFSIDSIVKEFEQDNEAQEKERAQDIEADKILKEIIPSIVLERSKHATL